MTKDKEILIMLSDLLAAKIKLLNDILKITHKQKNSIEEENITLLNKSISSKQKIINKIDTIDIEFNKVIDELKQIHNVKSFDEINFYDKNLIKKLQDHISEVKKIVSQIIELDKSTTQNSKNLLIKLTKNIKKINSAKKTTSAYNYGNTIKNPSYFIDKKK